MWMDSFVLNLPLHTWPILNVRAPSTHRVLFRFFETRRAVVVLSSSNQASREAYPEQCDATGVPILKRRGGGGTVVLGPGCLVLTFSFFARDLFGNNRYFEIINGLWAGALAQAGIPGVVQRGISDLAVGEQKIAGTSLFRRKHLVVYQGSLLVDPDFSLISSLLGHPSREPDYRRGRTHTEFLTSCRAQGSLLSSAELAVKCSEYFSIYAHDALASEFVEPEILAQGGRPFWNSPAHDMA